MGMTSLTGQRARVLGILGLCSVLLVVLVMLVAQGPVGASPARGRVAVQSVPAIVSFQGLLTDAEGTPLDGPYTVRFTLYDVATGGAPLWLEEYQLVVTRGLLNVYLGSQNSLEWFFDGADYYLGVSVQGEDEMSPRMRIGSVPYACTAQRSFYAP